jgi:hypothetical protein
VFNSSRSKALAEREHANRLSRGHLFGALSIAGVGALGAFPGSRGHSDPVALLVWLSMCSLPAGVLSGASTSPLWPIAPVVPALWMGLVGIVAAASTRILPSPAWAALAWSGLYGIGFATGRITPARRWRSAAVLFLLAAALNALAIAGAWLASPLPPAIAARALDLSPATLLAECAGLDWMRHPSIYEPAGALDIDPSLRVAWRGMLAGPSVFLVGCLAAFVADRIAGRGDRKRIDSETAAEHS